MAHYTESLPENYLASIPDEKGFFGKFGGSFIPPNLEAELDAIYKEYVRVKDTPEFKDELHAIRRDFQGRPTPLFYCKRMSEALGGGKEKGVEIWLKREDLSMFLEAERRGNSLDNLL